jgi:predicted phosphodiesterase
MQKIILNRQRSAGKNSLKALVLLVLAAIIAFEAFVVLAEKKSRQPLPPLLGNFAEIRAVLEGAAPKEEFSFAVFGDTEGATTGFDLLARKLGVKPVDFAVHLGDAYAKTFPYFRLKISEDLALPFPLFMVAGNHDIADFPLVLYEELFGPSLFSFIYQECLFIGLRVEGDPLSTTASLRFLEDVLQGAGGAGVRKIFVFMHVPPQILPGHKFAAPAKFVSLFDRFGVDYVISGHYHGYAQVEKGATTYMVSGAAGKHLETTPYGQFHHGLVITVGRDFVSKTVVPLPPTSPLSNKLQRFAIVEVYPWFLANRALVAGINLLVLLMALATVRSMWARGR